jgi:uncharacterized protein GlcG (DUF336 family)
VPFHHHQEKNMTRKLLVAAALAATATSAAAVEMRPILTLDMAKKMAAACEERAKAEGWKMNIAILDAGGNLKHFVRMDDAYLKSVEIAMLKAGTSAGFPFSTKQVGEIVQRVPGIVHVPGIVTFEGGMPIMTAAGQHIGAIGVSGARADQDGVCAQAALDAIKDDLK